MSMNALELAHVVRLHEPEIEGQEVRFSWDVTPPSDLYYRTSIGLTFPEGLDLDSVPRSLWWRVMLISLHTHFALLRPCRVELPVTLGRGEREFWARLIQHVADQLENYGSPRRPGAAAVLVESGPHLPPLLLRTASDRVALAFSGGKDSLVLAALASELTRDPLLVRVSPSTLATDPVAAAREFALRQPPERLPGRVIDVISDFRDSWDVHFSLRDGGTFPVNELSDLPLYHGTVAAVAAASGIGTCLMASEADIQYNAAHGDGVILHREFLSCSATQSALDALLRAFGLRQGSLTFPLHMPQVQQLLWRRYRAIADLQRSCLMAGVDDDSCGACLKCFLVAVVMLAEGASPRAVGIDPVRVLTEWGDWPVDAPPFNPGATLSEHRSPRQKIVRALQRRTTAEVATILSADPLARDDRRLGQAIAVWARMRAQALAQITPPDPGYVPEFLDFVPADMRTPLEPILAQHFAPTSEPEFRAMAKRARTLAAWITAPLESSSRPRLRPRVTA